MTATTYFVKLKTLWELLGSYNVNDLCDYGWECTLYKKIISDQNNNKIVEFFMGLNDECSNIQSQLLGMKHFPSLADAYNLVLQDEK